MFSTEVQNLWRGKQRKREERGKGEEGVENMRMGMNVRINGNK